MHNKKSYFYHATYNTVKPIKSASGSKMMGLASAKTEHKTSLNIVVRIIAAIVGGYLLANLIVILLSYLLPGSQANNVMTGMLASYPIYAAVMLWVFASKTIRQVWLGLLFSCLACAMLIFILIPEGLF